MEGRSLKGKGRSENNCEADYLDFSQAPTFIQHSEHLMVVSCGADQHPLLLLWCQLGHREKHILRYTDKLGHKETS